MDTSILGPALIFYQQHLESLKQQAESELPNKGKSTATPEDLSRDLEFEGKIHAVTDLLNSLAKTTEQSGTSVKAVAAPKPTPPVISRTKSPDASDSEPYLNPFSGQWITPVTVFSPGPSHLETIPKEAIVSGIERSKAIIKGSSSPAINQNTNSESLFRNGDAGELRTGIRSGSKLVSSRSVFSKKVAPSRTSTVKSRLPSATLYSSSEADIEPSLASLASRIAKDSPGLNLLRTKSKNVAADSSGLKAGEDGIIAAAAQARSPAMIHEMKHAGNSKAIPMLAHSHIKRPRASDSVVKGFPAQQPERDPWANEDPPQIVPDIPYSNKIHQTRIVTRDPPKVSIRVGAALAPTARTRVYAAQGLRPRPEQSIPLEDQDNKRVHNNHIRLAAGNGRSVGTSQNADSVANHATTQSRSDSNESQNANSGDSRYLPQSDPQGWAPASELSGYSPQDYATLQGIQRDSELAAQSNRELIYQLHSSNLEEQRRFEVDLRLAQTMADDIPQEAETLSRVEAERLSQLQQDARFAMEVAEREEQAERAAQIRALQEMEDELNIAEAQQLANDQDAARRLEEEWNASEVRQLAEDLYAARLLEEEWNASEAQQSAEKLEAARRLEEEWNASEARQLAAEQQAARRLEEEWNTADAAQAADLVHARAVSDEQDRLECERKLLERQRQAIRDQIAARSATIYTPLPSALPPPRAALSRTPSAVVVPPHDDDLARAIAYRRQRPSQWRAEAQRSGNAARAAEKEIGNLELKHSERAERARQEAEQASLHKQQRIDTVKRERRAREVECTSCGESADRDKMVILDCKHAYDRKCITAAFKVNLSSKKLFTCCNRTRVPVDAAARFLPSSLVAAYRALMLELETPSPIYCAIPRCAAFIPPPSIHGDRATCQRCSMVTCRLCKNPWHQGVCAEDENGRRLLALAGQQKWIQCARCKHIVEKSEGCLHMTCRCGYEFCYNCGSPYGQCPGTCNRR